MHTITAQLPRPPLPRLSRSGSFALHASAVVSLLAASSAPTPLYDEYQTQWHFSALTVTIVFSSYALALLVALLVAGTLSDYLGRRPVLTGALLAEAASMALFATAQGVTELIAARVVQGLATGVATGAAGAALLDFEHPRHPGRAALANSLTPVSGMATGVLASTGLVQFAPAPTHTVYLLLLLLFATQTALVTRTAETARSHRGVWRSLQPGISVARASRTAMLLITPGVIAAWALGGFYSSLGPQLARLIAPHAPDTTGGLVFFALTASAALAICATRTRPARTVSTAGAIALMSGALLTLVSPYLQSLSALFVGTLLAGAGFGAVTQGALRLLLPPAAPEERAGTLASYYVLSYLAMSVPAVLAGLLTMRYGLETAVLLYAGSTGLLALSALVALATSGRRPLST
ncbi:MFS transporter [Streptomyces sp. AF1A]|jgi:MFS family permease|uniref:MFS transporter n=1 Tax=Streptomyces sp. AF1A TaxID=3394350 RepID=UPI0039BC6C59